MPAVKQTSKDKTANAASPKIGHFTVVQKGTSSAATKEAVKSNADRHREAMIRLANR